MHARGERASAAQIVLSPAARQRFLGALEPTLSARFDPRLDYPAALLGQWADADHAGRSAALALDAPILESDAP